MAHVYELVKTRVYSIEADKTVLEAARLIMEHLSAPCRLYLEANSRNSVQRDIMNRVVAVGRQPGTTRVSEVMTARPRTVGSQETVENCLFLMREFGFRHLPICDGKELKGLVSSRDILLRQLAERESEARKYGT